MNLTTLWDWLQEQVNTRNLRPTWTNKGKGNGEKRRGRHPDGSTFAADFRALLRTTGILLKYAQRLPSYQLTNVFKQLRTLNSALAASMPDIFPESVQHQSNAELTNGQRNITLLSMVPDEHTARLGNTPSRFTSHAIQRSCSKYRHVRHVRHGQYLLVDPNWHRPKSWSSQP